LVNAGSVDNAMLPFFFIMLLLAAIPSASVALVVSRSATHGVRSGLAVAAGIVMGDLLFVALALAGMTALAEAMGGFFFVVRILAGTYLIYLGVRLWKGSGGTSTVTSANGKGSMATSFFAGWLLTLGDIKAVFFYASLFPTFFDLARLGWSELTGIFLVTILTVGGVKAFYALAARKLIARRAQAEVPRNVRRVAGGVLIGTGGYLIVKS